MIRINNNCLSCAVCVDICPVTALRLTKKSIVVDKGICIDCGICVKKCPFGAIEVAAGSANGAIIRDIRFQVTKGCNFNCAYCFSDAKKPLSDELSLAEACRMVDDLAKCGLKTMTLTGGEPLLRKEFSLKLLEYLHKKKIYSKLFTNGSLLDDETINKLSDIVDEVQISIHEPDDIYKTKKMPVLFMKLKQKGIRVVLRLTLTSRNYKEVKKILKFTEQNKIDCLRVRPFVAKGRGLNNRHELMDKIAYRKSIGYLASIRRDKNYTIQLLTPSFAFLYDKYIKPEIFSKKCFLGYTSCKCINDLGAILPNGEVRACAYFSQKLGNIRKQNFKEIWANNDVKKKLIVDCLEKECMECEYVTICGGGCRANAYINAGSLTAPDPNCPRLNTNKHE